MENISKKYLLYLAAIVNAGLSVFLSNRILNPIIGYDIWGINLIYHFFVIGFIQFLLWYLGRKIFKIY